jgi:hypothetical protein
MNDMKTNSRTKPGLTFRLLAAIGFGILFQNMLKADVIVLQSGAVVTGNILQQDAGSVLMQMEYGTYRYPPAWIRDVKKEPAAAPHASNNGQRIPDWAQIVSMLADNGWADGLRQVPATVINYGKFDSVPYLSFRCAAGGYELNIFGDLNQPAAIQIGAMNYLKDDAGAKSNCVNFICSVLSSAADRKTVRALDWSQKDKATNNGMVFETLLPGEWGSYGGWWVTAYNQNDLASARASEAELLVLAQPRVATVSPAMTPAQTTVIVTNVVAATTPPAVTTTTTTTSYGTATYGYGTTYATAAGWTEEELANAHPATPPPAYPDAANASAYPTKTAGQVYPRTYTRMAGTYDRRAEMRR